MFNLKKDCSKTVKYDRGNITVTVYDTIDTTKAYSALTAGAGTSIWVDKDCVDKLFRKN
jgi:hypothetical protein